MRYAAYTLLAFLFTLPIAHPIQAQDAILDGKKMLHTAMAQGDIDGLKTARAAFERAISSADDAVLAHYYVALTNQRLATLNEDDDVAVDYLDDAVEHLEAALDLDETFAEGHALLSSIYGLKISKQPIRGMFLGPKASGAVEAARELEPQNPRVVLVEAVGDFNTPSMFGGSKARAMKGFQQAIALFKHEEVTDPRQPDWGHDEAYAWLGIGYAEQDDEAAARRAFEQALEINPDNGWVKYQLLPQLDADGDS